MFYVSWNEDEWWICIYLYFKDDNSLLVVACHYLQTTPPLLTSLCVADAHSISFWTQCSFVRCLSSVTQWIIKYLRLLGSLSSYSLANLCYGYLNYIIDSSTIWYLRNYEVFSVTYLIWIFIKVVLFQNIYTNNSYILWFSQTF